LELEVGACFLHPGLVTPVRGAHDWRQAPRFFKDASLYGGGTIYSAEAEIDSVSSIYPFLEELDNLNYEHKTAYSNLLYQVKDFTKNGAKIFGGIAIVFSVFSSLLILTYISISINNKQKEIGILRALGTRERDIAKIFIFEGIFIALFAGIIANIITSSLIALVNQQNEKLDGYKVFIMYSNIYSILSVLLISLIIVTVSSYIPIKRITNKQPIKAIKRWYLFVR